MAEGGVLLAVFPGEVAPNLTVRGLLWQRARDCLSGGYPLAPFASQVMSAELPFKLPNLFSSNLLPKPLAIVNADASWRTPMTYNRSRLLQEIDDRLHRQPRLPLHDLEKELGIGRHTIEKVVRTATGKSFREYQSQILLAKASRMLTGREFLQIKQVAFSLGYFCTKSFSRYFKAHTGVTPSAFMANPGQRNDVLTSL